MSNTRTTMGEQECLDAIVSGSITEFVDDTVLDLTDNAFQYCEQLVSVVLPECERLGDFSFGFCSKLETVSLPKCTRVGRNAFNYCTALAGTVSMPEVTFVDYRGFFGCDLITAIDFPKCKTVGEGGFWDCNSLTSVNLPSCRMLGQQAFSTCEALTSLTLPMVVNVGAWTFGHCTSLTSLTLGSETVCSCNTATVLENTPIESGNGTIYVPAPLVSQYKAHSIWGRYDIAAIQG